MFGISFTEILLVLVVAIVVVGPQKLPKMMAAVGNGIGKLRRLSSEMRRQTGIDEILKEEGLDGGLTELRSIMRGDLSNVGPRSTGTYQAQSLYDDHVEYDRTRECPIEGPDAFGAIPEDLLGDDAPDDDEGASAAEGTEPTGATGQADPAATSSPAKAGAPTAPSKDHQAGADGTDGAADGSDADTPLTDPTNAKAPL